MDTPRNRFSYRLVCLVAIVGLLLNPALPALSLSAPPAVRAASGDDLVAVSQAGAAPASERPQESWAAPGLRPPEPAAPPTPTPATTPPASSGVMPIGDLSQGDQVAQPTGLCSASFDGQARTASAVTPLSATGAHWWHRSLEPSDEPFTCVAGGANVPNRVMYATDDCALLYLTVANPVDNERYTWNFYWPDGTAYTDGSYTFYYPNNPANPMPGYYVWRGIFYYQYYSYYPSSQNLAFGISIAGEDPS